MKVFRVEKGELVEMPEGFSEFTRGDSYLVDAGLKMYCWIGSESSVDTDNMHKQTMQAIQHTTTMMNIGNHIKEQSEKKQ